MSRKRIAIIGGGPSGLIAAYMLSCEHEVFIYEKEKSVGQKFLVAGSGGFNITNSITGDALCKKYIPKNFLKDALLDFDSIAVRNWLLELGIETFEGSSGRVFPIKGITPADVLKALKTKLEAQGVQIFVKHEFKGFDKDAGITIKAGGKLQNIVADYYVFALGGASWPVTGSNGAWIKLFAKKKLLTLPFQASNCGVVVNWPETIKNSHIGKPLKNISITVNHTREKGEALITEYGIEGNALYPLIPLIRNELAEKGIAYITIDLKPFNSEEQLLQKVQGKTSARTKNYAAIFNLDSMQLALIKAFIDKETFLSPAFFAANLKTLRIPVQNLPPLEEAISTIGGLDLSEINTDFSLKKIPNCYCIGEMVDWDAPTGGFLLQGCFSMGYWAAKSILAKENN